MKKILVLSILFISVALSAFAQPARTHTLSSAQYANDYVEYTFPVTSSDYISGYVNTTGLTYTLTLNKPVPSNAVWYLEMDSVKSASGTDSINVDVKINYKIFADQAAYVTSKTIAVDLDGSGDYKSLVADSSYLAPTNFTVGGDNVYLGKSDFAKVVQLSITPTSGPGVGKINDRVTVKKVKVRVILR